MTNDTQHEREAFEVTDAMVTAYLKANDAYWKEVDALPADITKPWRQGTPSEATRVSLKAALATKPESTLKAQGAMTFEVKCEDCGGAGLDRKDNNYGCSTCHGTGFVERMLYTSPVGEAPPHQTTQEAKP